MLSRRLIERKLKANIEVHHPNSNQSRPESSREMNERRTPKCQNVNWYSDQLLFMYISGSCVAICFGVELISKVSQFHTRFRTPSLVSYRAILV